MGEEAFLAEGYLLEANRQFFHPLGLQLVASVQEDGLRLRIVDRRCVLAGLIYGPEEDEGSMQATAPKGGAHQQRLGAAGSGPTQPIRFHHSAAGAPVVG
jgi:hypothetical protein